MGHVVNKFGEIVTAINNNNKALAKSLAEEGRDILCPEAVEAFGRVKEKLLTSGVPAADLIDLQNKIDYFFEV